MIDEKGLISSDIGHQSRESMRRMRGEKEVPVNHAAGGNTLLIDAICQDEILNFVQVVVINDDILPTIEAIADTSVG